MKPTLCQTLSVYLVVLITSLCRAIPRGPVPDQSMADAEEQQRPARIRKTSWARDAQIRDYRGGAVPDRLRAQPECMQMELVSNIYLKRLSL